MDELMDMMVDDASASQISDKLKDILFAKSAERVDAYRPDAANSLFGDNQAEDEVETDAEMQHTDSALVNPSAYTPSKRAKRKFNWVPARQGDNPLDEKQIEETAKRLEVEYTEFKNDK